MELKLDANTGWNSGFASDEQKITTLSPAFPSEDNFGSFIELGLHNQYLHGACEVHYNDLNIGSPMTAPVISTWFYKIHGLVDFWWAHFRSVHPSVSINHRFESAVKILFGVTNDGSGIVIGPDGKPHPVGPWNTTNQLSTQTKQAVIKLALSHLSEGVIEQHTKTELQNIIKKMN